MINKVILVGRLTADPELRKTNAGGSVASVRLACDGASRNQDGSRNSVFLNGSAFNQTADNVVKFARKGSLVYVEGRLNQRSFVRKDGTNGSAIELNIDTFRILDPKGQNQTEGVQDRANQLQDTVEPAEQSANLDLPDDDLPWLD